MTSRTLPAALLAAGLLTLGGCTPEQLADADLDDPPVEQTEQAIINGNAVARGSLAWRGIVRVGGGCTGTLLSNRFVLTARHCVRTWANDAWGAAAANVQVTLEGPTVADDQTITAARVLEPNTAGVDAGDYALIELRAPMEVGGSTTDFVNTIYDGADGDLEGRTVFCAGYGNNTEANRRTLTPGAGAGTLRSAWLAVTDSGGNTLTLGRNGNNQIGAPGDSGSTCFLGNEVLGVQSTCAGPWVDLNGNGTLDGNEWTQINTCTAASPNAYRAWVEARIDADVLLVFPTVPATGDLFTATVEAVNDAADVNLWTAVLVQQFARRGGRLEAYVEEPPAGYVCGRASTVTPTTGDAVMRGACLSHALAATTAL